MRNIVALWGLASDHCGPKLLKSYDAVMLKLADMVEPSVRAEAASRFAELQRAPAAIVHKLALDDIEVAQPLLIRSNLLTDDDLIGIAEIRGNRHRRVIATRPGIGERVSAVMAERGDDGVRRALAANVTARLSPEVLSKLLDQARRDVEMQDLLAEHPLASDEVLEALLEFGGENAQAVANRRRMAKAASAPRGRVMPVSRLFAGYDFEAAATRVRRRIQKKGITFKEISDLADDHEFGEAAVAISTLSGVDLREVLRWFAECDAQSILVTAKALGAGERDFCRLLNAGPIRFRLSANERAAALHTFRALEVETAKLIVAKRRQDVIKTRRARQ